MEENKKLSMQELGRMSAEAFRASQKAPIVVVLDNVRSGLNVGSVFRSSDAFRIARIYCCGITPVPPQRDILKTALGATETVEWEHSTDTLQTLQSLRDAGFECWAIEQTAASKKLNAWQPMAAQAPLALVFGNEVNGVDQSVINGCHGAIEIPQHGTKHSLNIAVCAGIVLYDVSNKML